MGDHTEPHVLLMESSLPREGEPGKVVAWGPVSWCDLMGGQLST